MSFNRETEIDLEQAAIFLKEALNKVMTQENPDLLNDLKKVFKKSVPFSKRMYVAAYLVKEAQLRNRNRFNNRHNGTAMHNNHGSYNAARNMQQKEARENATREIHSEEHTPHSHVQIDESLAATIFVSIGRNRRVYPRDLVGLLVSVANLDRDKIGNIRVLANYSFVQLFKDDAEKAIHALNGYDYRGRKLAVSYSRQKADEETAAFESYENHAENSYEAQEDECAYKTGENNEQNTPVNYMSEQNMPQNGTSLA
ncbi:MAG: DbpA RNA binding domain-containing protein [Treponema sp.]|nr:DbpA RNA binding domain-containing protein [Treponema sp.]